MLTDNFQFYVIHNWPAVYLLLFQAMLFVQQFNKDNIHTKYVYN